MTSSGFQRLTPSQEWVTAGEDHLYGEKAERFLQNCIHSMNWLYRSAQRLMRGIEYELKQQEKAQNMIQYAMSTNEMPAHIAIYCEMFLDKYEELQETQA